ncbi:MAG: ribosome-binding factor A [Candidatus Yonathbacteria bacterium]|nr:ribosome-binding factor A [Candidatus Yonathbacteria bacterium]
MTSARQDKMRQLLREIAAEFFSRESSGKSLITITDATISPDFKRATIYLTTIPSKEEEHAFQFAKRKRTDLREFIASKARLRTLPVLEVKIDEGERNRQKIDSLLKQG